MNNADEEIELSAEQLRSYFDGEDLPNSLETVLDQAQGDVLGGKDKFTILITVTK